jgi:hypothetical protein
MPKLQAIKTNAEDLSPPYTETRYLPVFSRADAGLQQKRALLDSSENLA